ncbi:MAG: Gldg family protein [Candidatus Methanofastidiosia archaeon]
MKMYILVIILAVFAAQVQQQEIQGKILIDIGHSSLDISLILGELARELEINYYDVEFTQSILYLDPYDVLVLAVPTVPFTTEELNAVRSFVEKGGGLFVLGESGVMSSKNVEDLNRLTSEYGIEFQRDVVVDPENNLRLDKAYPEIPIIENFASHPITKNVRKIFLVSGCSLILSQKARPLAWGGEQTYGDRLSELYGYGGGSYEPDLEKKGKDLVVLAYCESGERRVVAIGDTSLFRGLSTAGDPWTKNPLDYLDNKRLALNIFGWLSLKTKRAMVSEHMSQAETLIQEGNYQEALQVLGSARDMAMLIEEYGKAREISVLIVKVNRGIEADALLQEGKKNLEFSDCEAAAVSLEAALNIYEAIENKEKTEECLRLLSECGDTLAMVRQANLLLEEAQTLVGQRKFAQAMEKTREARSLYERLEIPEKVEECDKLLASIQEYQQGQSEEKKTSERNRAILAAIVIGTSIIIVVLFLWRRSQPPYPEPPPSRFPQ